MKKLLLPVILLLLLTILAFSGCTSSGEEYEYQLWFEFQSENGTPAYYNFTVYVDGKEFAARR